MAEQPDESSSVISKIDVHVLAKLRVYVYIFVT